MNNSLRLYFESVVRLATAADPRTMADGELIGVVGLLPSPAVSYTEWSEKTGIGKEAKQEGITEEDAGRINDAAIKARELMELERNGGNTE